MDISERAQHSALVGAFNKAKLGEYNNVLVHTLDIAFGPSRELAYWQRSRTDQGFDHRPAFLRKTTEKDLGRFEIECLALIAASTSVSARGGISFRI